MSCASNPGSSPLILEKLRSAMLDSLSLSQLVGDRRFINLGDGAHGLSAVGEKETPQFYQRCADQRCEAKTFHCCLPSRSANSKTSNHSSESALLSPVSAAWPPRRKRFKCLCTSHPLSWEMVSNFTFKPAPAKHKRLLASEKPPLSASGVFHLFASKLMASARKSSSFFSLSALCL